MPDSPKYTLPEIERRWLVDPAAIGSLEDRAFRDVEDLYVAHTRLRLRKTVDARGEVAFKLCKKYGRRSGLSEPITNLYLSEAEFELISRLEGHSVPGFVREEVTHDAAYCGAALALRAS